VLWCALPCTSCVACHHASEFDTLLQDLLTSHTIYLWIDSPPPSPSVPRANLETVSEPVWSQSLNRIREPASAPLSQSEEVISESTPAPSSVPRANPKNISLNSCCPPPPLPPPHQAPEPCSACRRNARTTTACALITSWIHVWQPPASPQSHMFFMHFDMQMPCPTTASLCPGAPTLEWPDRSLSHVRKGSGETCSPFTCISTHIA
jgi:hypothetical protein